MKFTKEDSGKKMYALEIFLVFLNVAHKKMQTDL